LVVKDGRFGDDERGRDDYDRVRRIAMQKRHVLVIDDDPWFCGLVRATLELEGIHVDEAHHVIEAERFIMDRVPDAIVLDIGLPGIDGLFYCERLRESPRTASVPIIVISGSKEAGARARSVGATAFVRKPFDPLELLSLLEVSVGDTPLERSFGADVSPGQAENAAELRRLIDIGHRQHELLDDAYRRTVAALAAALETRDTRPSSHPERVTAYAMRIAVEVEPVLTDDPSLEWGFLLHDVGKIAIPERILLKPKDTLDPAERAQLEGHTLLGEQLLQHVPLLHGEGLRVIRSHHERWDGQGFPDRLGHDHIPIGARIFAVADALDALTAGGRGRTPLAWDAALAEIRQSRATRFDPDIVDGLVACETDLYAIWESRQSATLAAV
jgi:ribonuclease P protein subunit RPR2